MDDQTPQDPAAQPDEPAAQPAEEPQEQIQEEAPVAPEPAEEPAAEETPTPAEDPELTPAQQQRVQRAIEKGDDPLKISRLIQNMKRSYTEQPRSASRVDYREMIEAEPEVYDQLEQKTQQYGQEQYNAGLEQAKAIQFRTLLEIDTPRIEGKYEQFNRESPNFAPGVVNAVNEMYLALVGFDPATGMVANPDFRYADFVDGFMELNQALVGHRTAQTAKNVAQQAANTGLRPDGSAPKSMDLSKDPSQMTEEELKAAINATTPRDSKGRFTSK